MKKTRLLVVDDHPVVRAGLRTLLANQLDMEVVGEAVDGASAVECVLALQPDVVVMDITMSGMNGVTATREIKRLRPQTQVLVLTMHDNEEYLRQMLQAGASGYVLKQAADTELTVAIRAVRRGEIFLYPSFTRVLLGDLAPRGGADSAVRHEGGQEPLSQREVLRLVALGYTNRQIGDQLHLGVRTIETYRARLMEKLSIKSRAALVRYALLHGLLDEDPDAGTGDV